MLIVSYILPVFLYYPYPLHIENNGG